MMMAMMKGKAAWPKFRLRALGLHCFSGGPDVDPSQHSRVLTVAGPRKIGFMG